MFSVDYRIGYGAFCSIATCCGITFPRLSISRASIATIAPGTSGGVTVTASSNIPYEPTVSGPTLCT